MSHWPISSARCENKIIFSYRSPTINHTKAIAQSSQQQVVTTHQAPVEQVDLVDLKEWATHRVLAKRKEIYVPGVIAPSNLPSSVLVNLDYPEGQQQLYHDIFTSGRFDVISDRVPSLTDVS